MASCGCCGVETSTCTGRGGPAGLDTVPYRVGTHDRFLRVMLERLTTSGLPALRGLTTRAADDFSIALLDGWATVADVLTFYQERIFNEGYLRTATERRSILELGRLVGYELRPGVAASVHLAFTLEDEHQVVIPVGTPAQSLPKQGELPQTFETIEPVEASSDLNLLRPRLLRPQQLPQGKFEPGKPAPDIRLAGVDLGIRKSDVVLLAFAPLDVEEELSPQLAQAAEVREDRAAAVTVVAVVPRPLPKPQKRPGLGGAQIVDKLRELVHPAELPAPPASAAHLDATVSQDAFAPTSDLVPRLFGRLHPETAAAAWTAIAQSPFTSDSALSAVLALRVRAGVFGNLAPRQFIPAKGGGGTSEEWPIAGTPTEQVVTFRYKGIKDKPPEAFFALSSAGKQAPDSDKVVKFDVQTSREVDTFAADVRVDFTSDGGPQDVTAKLSSADDDFKVNFSVTSDDGEITYSLTDEQSKGEELLNLGPGETGTTALGDFAIQVEVSADGADATLSLTRVTAGPVDPKVLPLDGVYDQVAPGSWIVVERPNGTRDVNKVNAVRTVSRSAYGIVAKVTELLLQNAWTKGETSLGQLRAIQVYAQSEALALALEPFADIVDKGAPGAVAGPEIELDEIYRGLESGRWIIVGGERADLGETRGVPAAEVAMVASVRHGVAQIAADQPVPATGKVAPLQELPGDTAHTFIRLASPLVYSYRRATLLFYGNVVRALHGETRAEVLGSGDGSALAQFSLRQTPLTFRPVATASRAQSTLEVRVEKLLWRQVSSLAALDPGDHAYLLRINDDGKTTVTFGDGVHGGRPPTGAENITAVYRRGLGVGGNVGADRISLLPVRPVGVKAVSNPVASAGGADRESRDQARRNLPLATRTLGRIVSVPDYADFARQFAGIAKASATALSDGRRRLVHLTVAGAADTPVRKDSELYRILVRAIAEACDPAQPFQVDPRELLLLVFAARIRIDAVHDWPDVEASARAALLAAFGFERGELGRSVAQSEVVMVLQSVPGVEEVVVDQFTAVSDETLAGAEPLGSSNGVPPLEQIDVGLAQPADKSAIRPAQIAIFEPAIHETLRLSVKT